MDNLPWKVLEKIVLEFDHDIHTVNRIFDTLTKAVGRLGFLYESVNIRDPGYLISPQNVYAKGWHQDGPNYAPRDIDLIIWCNEAPTLFKSIIDPYNIWQPEPYDLVLIHNLACYHKQPDVIPPNRIFYRAFGVYKKEKE